MSKQTQIHATLLAMQLASVFRYVADTDHHRSVFGQFQPLENNVIVYNYEENVGRKGRSVVDVIIKTERYSFILRQWYNFGILLELELTFMHDNAVWPFLECAKKGDDPELMIDFEYAISIFTEHVASQLNKLGQCTNECHS